MSRPGKQPALPATYLSLGQGADVAPCHHGLLRGHACHCLQPRPCIRSHFNTHHNKKTKLASGELGPPWYPW
eukprot:scaffold155269_cov17-Tisochrysis_lutea.AAC.1